MRCIKTRGKKGVPHTDKDDPPRRRANSIKGHGTWENDRPPVVGIAGRDTHGLRLRVTRLTFPNPDWRVSVPHRG